MIKQKQADRLVCLFLFFWLFLHVEISTGPIDVVAYFRQLVFK